MPEGRVYKVGWNQTSTGWRLWLLDHPRIAADVATLDDPAATEALLEPVCREFGDGEPTFTFHPPVPPAAVDAPFIARGLGLIVNHACAWIAGNVTDYFSGRVCELCLRITGERNDAALVESRPPEGDLCDRNPMDFGPVVATERFVALLSPSERDAVELRPCVRSARARRKVYEVIPKVIVPKVPVLGIPRPALRCGACGNTFFRNELPSSDMRTFIADSAIDADVPALFGVGSSQHLQLATTFTRATELAGHPHARGAGATRLGTVPPDRIDNNPAIEVRNEPWQFGLPKPLRPR